MKVTNEMKAQARDADLIKFMDENYPGRLKKCGDYWRDMEYPDVTVWWNLALEQYKFKAHAPKTIEYNDQIQGSDTIAYLRKLLGYSFTDAVEALLKYPIIL